MIVVLNFPFGAGFTGWDNMHPEFNYAVNLKRIFSVWQEKGLGLLVAMVIWLMAFIWFLLG